jgi:subtilisin family serine protease
MRRLLLIAASLLVALSSSASSNDFFAPGPIQTFTPEPDPSWRWIDFGNGIAFDPMAGEPSQPADLRIADYPGDGTGYYLVQVTGPIRETVYSEMKGLGANVLGLHSRCNFIVRMNSAVKAKVARLPLVRWIGLYQPAYKLAPGLLAGSPTDRYLVYLFHTEDAAANQRAIELAGARVLSSDITEDIKFFWVEMSPGLIAKLAGLPGVSHIEAWHPSEPENNQVQWVNQKGIAPPDTTRPVWRQRIFGGDFWGDLSGEILGHCDDGLDVSHYAFRDPAITISDTGEWPTSRKIVAYKHYPKASGITRSSHGTHTAGTICGNDSAMGGTDARDGHSKNARLVHLSPIPTSSYNFYSVFTYLTDSLRNRSLQATTCSNSWWTGTLGQYSAKSSEVDLFCWRHRTFVLIKSCGNQYHTSQYRITEPGNSKSVISAGALGNGTLADSLATFSSCGPAPDGRVKPDICTPGDAIYSASYNTTNSYVSMSGTSMAAPSTNGSIGLIRSYLRKGFYPSGTRRAQDSLAYVSGALLKSMLIVSADPNVGGYVVPSDHIGWGRLDLDSVLFFSGDRRKLLLWDDTTGIATGQYRDYRFTLNDAIPLRITACWTDTPAAANANPALINDLDLLVTAPSGTYYRGNQYTSGQSTVNPSSWDRRDVVECARVNAPQTGTWTLRISAQSVATRPQPYAVAVTGGVVPYSGVEETPSGLPGPPKAFALGEARPNPAVRGEVEIAYATSAEKTPLTLKVYDIQGRLIRTLVEGVSENAGWHQVHWNGRDNLGRPVASGIYFYHLEAPGYRASRKLLYLR